MKRTSSIPYWIACGTMLCVLGCGPSGAPSGGPSTGPPIVTGPKSLAFGTWQQSSVQGVSELQGLLKKGLALGTNVNPDSLDIVSPGFGMPRFLLDFSKVTSATPSNTLDQLIRKRRSVVGIMTGTAMAITVVENADVGGMWHATTLGDRRITDRVNAIFSDVPMAELDSLVMYEVHNLRARAFKVITVDGRTLFYTGFGMPDGTLLQSTEPAIVTSFKNAANAFLLANPGVLGNDSITG